VNEILAKAISTFNKSEKAYAKFITGNDAGATGAHQSGFHISKQGWSLFFDKPGEKGQNKDIFITIKWQDDFETDSRFIYYGEKTRNEYRLTRFGKGFPFLTDEYVGDLLIICQSQEKNYQAFVITGDENVEDFLSGTDLSITETNKVIAPRHKENSTEVLVKLINSIVKEITMSFPASKIISNAAQEIYLKAYAVSRTIAIQEPDETIVHLINAEYELFKAIESKLYSSQLQKGVKTIDELIDIANTLLNRRKSRAGKALENHLASIFDTNKLRYETQVKTEGNKKPDFIFPDGNSYHNISFKVEKLFFLGAKTTCKDRWRQILNEADRIKVKHLMTFQQGISVNQIEEMEKHHVVLVVPKIYHNAYPKEKRSSILSLEQFIGKVKNTQS
jgi:hypothetical protein